MCYDSLEKNIRIFSIGGISEFLDIHVMGDRYDRIQKNPQKQNSARFQSFIFNINFGLTWNDILISEKV